MKRFVGVTAGLIRFSAHRVPRLSDFGADSSRFAPASRFCRACVSPRQHVVRPRALLDFLRCRESF
jgi:hypothetical protein